MNFVNQWEIDRKLDYCDMSQSNLHLFLIFSIGREFFGMDVRHIDKLFRSPDSSDNADMYVREFNHFQSLYEKQNKVSMVDLRRTLLVKGTADIKLPTLILFHDIILFDEAPTGVIVDYVYGVESIYPDDISVIHTDEKEIRAAFLNSFYTGETELNILDNTNQERKVTVKILDPHSICMYGIPEFKSPH